MERYFTPVQGSSEDEVKIHKHYKPISHRHPHNYQYHHSQYHNHGSHSHSSSSSHGKHSDNHDHNHHDNRHYPYYHRYPKVAGDHRSYTKTSSSSLSSSSSTSSASWTSEPSLDDETYLNNNKPQHSLSCSNISEVQRKIREDFDFDHRDQLHSPNQRQRHSLEHSEQLLPSFQHGHRPLKLCRGHSKSEEGLQQNEHRETEGSHAIEHGTLYKTASLGYSLTLNGNTENTLGGRGATKKAVSSIQLPSKGILKNKDEGQNKGNFRKSKSMEVLSTRVHVTEMSKQSSMEATRQNVVKGKLQFSAFLDEITRQVISPSTLSSLGVTTPKSPNDEHKLYADKLKQESVVPSPKQQPVRAERPDSGKTDSSSCSRSLQKSHSGKQHQNQYLSRNLTSPPAMPPRHPSKAERRGATSDKQHYRQYSQLLTDGTSTSPEPVQSHLSQHKERHQSTQGPARHFRPKQEHKSSSLLPLRPPGSSTGASSQKHDKSKQIGHRKHSRAHRDSVSAMDTVQLLEQYNKELHENLLQMVSCIENMEAELQHTRTELSSFKEKYRRLQESYAVAQQVNSVLEQKHKSMVPSLIRELLKKPFDSREAQESILYTQTFLAKHDTDQSDRGKELKNSQSSGEKMEERVFKWLQTGCSDSCQQPAAAFLPWKHDHDPWAGQEPQLPFSAADGLPIYKAVTVAKSPTLQAHQFGMNTEINIVAMPTHRGVAVSPKPYDLNEIRPNRQAGGDLREEGPVTVRKDPNDFSYLAANRVLDNFLSQFPPPAHGGEAKDSLEAVMGARKLAEGN